MVTDAITNETTVDRIWDLLDHVMDPEIPVISVVDLGIVRDVRDGGDGLDVVITPTYSGCPAMNLFKEEILKTLNTNGYRNVKIKLIYHPAWTTDWMSKETRQKLKEYGIAPPEKSGTNPHNLALFQNEKKIVACPFCDAENTRLKSQFGATACKALYFCDACLQPFEHFKCI